MNAAHLKQPKSCRQESSPTPAPPSAPLFTEDASRILQRHASQTSAMLRRLEVSVLSSDTSIKDNIRDKRNRAWLSKDVLEQLLLNISLN